MKKTVLFSGLLLLLTTLYQCGNKESNNSEESIKDTLIQLSLKWNDCLKNKDVKELESLYSESVLTYGKQLLKQEVIEGKKSFFKLYPDFDQKIIGEIKVDTTNDEAFKVSFLKYSFYKGKGSEVKAYLVYKKINDKWKIVTESDELTDLNKRRAKKQTSGSLLIGDSIQGDFDGDGIMESASYRIKKEGGFEEEYEMDINFSSPAIKTLPFNATRDYITLINESDLNGIAGDELTVYSSPNHGCTYTMTTYTYNNNKWKEIMEPILVLTFCDPMPVEDLLKMIFREGNTIYYYQKVSMDETFELEKFNAELK